MLSRICRENKEHLQHCMLSFLHNGVIRIVVESEGGAPRIVHVVCAGLSAQRVSCPIPNHVYPRKSSWLAHAYETNTPERAKMSQASAARTQKSQLSVCVSAARHRQGDNTYNSSYPLATTTHTLLLMATGVTMRVLVFGPTGGTGLELCAQAIGRGHDVTAFARSPSKLTESSLKVEGVSGFTVPLTRTLLIFMFQVCTSMWHGFFTRRDHCSCGVTHFLWCISLLSSVVQCELLTFTFHIVCSPLFLFDLQ